MNETTKTLNELIDRVDDLQAGLQTVFENMEVEADIHYDGYRIVNRSFLPLCLPDKVSEAKRMKEIERWLSE